MPIEDIVVYDRIFPQILRFPHRQRVVRYHHIKGYAIPEFFNIPPFPKEADFLTFQYLWGLGDSLGISDARSYLYFNKKGEDHVPPSILALPCYELRRLELRYVAWARSQIRRA